MSGVLKVKTKDGFRPVGTGGGAFVTTVNGVAPDKNGNVEVEVEAVIPDMAQNDPTQPDYVKNRTHYDSRRTGEVKITFDGVLDGKEYIDVGNGEYYVKVSELTLSSEEMIGGTVEFIMNGESATREITEDSIVYMNETMMFVANAVTVCHEDTEFEGMAFSKGVYFPCAPSSNTYAANLSYTGTVGELKKLDEKYLPDSVQNKTYRFCGWRDEDNYFILEKGDLMEYMDMLFAGVCETAEVLDTTNFPATVVYPLTGKVNGDMGETLQFQKLWFKKGNNGQYTNIVGGLIEIGPDGAGYRELPYNVLPG